MWKRILGILASSLLWAGTAGAQTLGGNQSMVVDSYQMAGYGLNDSSRLDVVQGGNLTIGVLMRDSATLNVLAGGKVAEIQAHNTSRVNISQGTVYSPSVDAGGDMLLFDDSVATLSEASVDWVALVNNTRMTASSSTIGGIAVWDTASLEMTGGNLGSLSVNANSTATLVDVGMTGDLTVYGHVVLDGGSIPSLSGHGGQTTFYGSDFLATDGLSFSGDQVFGTGTLSGKWLDGSTFSTAITQNTGTIYAVPEPATMSLLAIGGLALLRRKTGYAV